MSANRLRNVVIAGVAMAIVWFAIEPFLYAYSMNVAVQYLFDRGEYRGTVEVRAAVAVVFSAVAYACLARAART